MALNISLKTTQIIQEFSHFSVIAALQFCSLFFGTMREILKSQYSSCRFLKSLFLHIFVLLE